MNDAAQDSGVIRGSFQQALGVFQRQNGIMRTGQALAQGVDTRVIAEMHDAGYLDKLSRGVYRLADLPPLDYPDLVVVSLRAPQAVICLQSALAFHELTTEIPHRVHIALPKSIRPPRLDYPPLRVAWLSPESYAAGVETHQLDRVAVQIYSAAKSVADCFKFRNKIGRDIAIDALRDYLRRDDVDIDNLLRMAETNRVDRVLRPYLEAMLR